MMAQLSTLLARVNEYKQYTRVLTQMHMGRFSTKRNWQVCIFFTGCSHNAQDVEYFITSSSQRREDGSDGRVYTNY